jgi:hypothetical protein
MSLSYESLTLRRKRTATDRALNNGDPLVVKKKAREAVNKPDKMTRAESSVTTDPKVSHFHFDALEKITLNR